MFLSEYLVVYWAFVMRRPW